MPPILSRPARNRRLAIFLGMVAAGLYAAIALRLAQGG